MTEQSTMKRWWNYSTGLYTIQGTAKRKDMWIALGVTYAWLGIAAIMWICAAIVAASENVPFAIIFGLLGLPPFVMAMITSLGAAIWLTIRRMHDFGLSGWVYFGPAIAFGIIGAFIPPVSWVWTVIAFVWLYALPANLTHNKYDVVEQT